MVTVGIDIGTTTISVVVTDNETNKMLRAITIPNNSSVAGQQQRLQNPGKILEYVYAVIKELSEKFFITKIGITGQMHGVLYIDKDGNAVSPLYTWQNTFGNEIYRHSTTYSAYIEKITGYPAASGYGCVTHFYLQSTGQIPEKAVYICTIGDYIAMRLTNTSRPVMHISNAASLGLYDVKRNRFDEQAMDLLAIDPDYFPSIERGFIPIGTTEDGIIVSIAIGDNQASFLGAVEDMEHDILINIGTGGQISCYSDKYIKSFQYETRPFMENSYLLVSSSLCGGRAYAALEQFFREVLTMAGIEKDSVYEKMEKLMKTASVENPVTVKTQFTGTRTEPEKRGEIGNIDLFNFTPQHMIHGFLTGIAQELYPPYEEFCKTKKFTSIIASGNAVRMNDYFRQVLSNVFSLPLEITDYSEEAAFGASLYADRIHL